MFDALTISAIVEEMQSELLDGRIQRVQHIDEMTLGLEIYARRQRRWLVISANSQQARILLLDERAGGDPERVSPLLLLLRKYARGGRIISIHQPRYERLVEIEFELSDPNAGDDEIPELIRRRLIIELMGRHSNIVLVDDEGLVQEAIKRVTSRMSRVRPILPNQRYSPPPPQDKLDPLAAAASDFADPELSGATWRALISLYLAMSPLLAREACFRADLDPQTDLADLEPSQRELLAAAVREIFSVMASRDWKPQLYQFEGGGAEFSAIPMHSLEARDDAEVIPIESVLEAARIATQRGPARPPKADRHAARRERLLQEIERAMGRLTARQQSLQSEAESAADPEELQERGNLIYAYQWMISPGDRELTTPEGTTIQLDPDLSVSENAQHYFERYRKVRSARETIPKRLAEVEGLIAYAQQLATMASQAETFDEIETIRAEWEEFEEETPGLGSTSGRKRRPKATKRSRRYTTASGHHIYIGRSGKQNEDVTFGIANPDDLWLHARDLPGAHVILRFNSPEHHDETILQAAALAAHYSQGRDATRVPVDVTERRNVRKIRGAGPGMVTYRNEYTLNVEPRSEHDLGLTSAEGAPD